MKAQLYTLGDDILLKKLKEASEIKYEAVCNKNLTQIFNRAEKMTPVDSGELRLSRGITPATSGIDGEFGYVKEYAPHVEFGHRTRNGGYVPGQRFLEGNTELQRPILHSDLEVAIRRVI